MGSSGGAQINNELPKFWRRRLPARSWCFSNLGQRWLFMICRKCKRCPYVNRRNFKCSKSYFWPSLRYHLLLRLHSHKIVRCPISRVDRRVMCRRIWAICRDLSRPRLLANLGSNIFRAALRSRITQGTCLARNKKPRSIRRSRSDEIISIKRAHDLS